MDRHHASDSAEHAAVDDDSGTTAREATPPGTGSRFDDLHNNVVYQRRRVNPESLALRLGPELVRDLDALIIPGNIEMPSFAVRKELQERYNIDRRHVYDYFHSRGLRVVKEDKHGNPVAVSQDAPTAPLPNLRPLRNAPIKSNRRHGGSHSVAAERKVSKPRGITKPGRPKKNKQHVNRKVVRPSSGMICETQESNESTGPAFSEDSPSGPVPSTSGYITVNPLLPQDPLVSISMVEEDDGYAFNSVANPLDGSFSVKRAIGDIAYAYRHKLVFERMQELAECPAKPGHTSEDRLFSWNETSPGSANTTGLLLPHAPMPLTQDERHAIYETLSSSVGPAHGIQECQGTYRKFLAAQTKLYFEGLLHGRCHGSQQHGRSDSVPERKPNEFRHWLSETRFLKRDGSTYGAQGSHRNTNVAKKDAIDGGYDKQFRQRTVARWLPSLDELFPAPEDSRSDGGGLNLIADSPVLLPTRQVTGAREVLSQFRARDDASSLPFSAISISPGSPKFAVTSASAGSVTYTQIHGPSGFPLAGPLQPHFTGTSTEVLHLEPGWTELVPSTAAHTLQHPPSCRNISDNVRSRVPSGSPRKRQVHDLDRIWTRPATTPTRRDARRRTPSAAGDI